MLSDTVEPSGYGPETLKLDPQFQLDMGSAFVDLVMQWVNDQLEQAGSMRRLKNLDVDLKDCTIYAIILSCIVPNISTDERLRELVRLPLDEHGINERGWNFIYLLRQYDITEKYMIPEWFGMAKFNLILLSVMFRKFVLCSEPVKVNPVHLYDSITQLEEQRDFYKDKCKELELEIKRKEDTIANIEIDRISKIHETLQDCHQVISNFEQRRLQMFENSQEYSITAFNNEGKKIVFKIPAPNLKQRCSFDMEEICSGIGDIDYSHDSRISRYYMRSSSCEQSSSMICSDKLDECEKSASDLRDSVLTMISERLCQIQQIQLLAAKIDEMNWLNNVMGEKVKQFSESLLERTSNRKSFFR